MHTANNGQNGAYQKTRDIHSHVIWFPTSFVRVRRPEHLRLPAPPSSPHPWDPVVISVWNISGSTPIISEARQVELHTAQGLNVDQHMGFLVPPPTVFNSPHLRSLYLYNWVYLSPTFYYRLETNQGDSEPSQTTQNWRDTLSGCRNPGGSKNYYVGPDFGLSHCVSKLPSGQFDLTWRDHLIPDEKSLNDIKLLSALMWELSEILFLYSFIRLDRRIVPLGSSWASARRLAFINGWTGGFSILPEFHTDRVVEDDCAWITQMPAFVCMVNIMQVWPGFPQVLAGTDVFHNLSFQRFDRIRRLAISFYAQTYADHFSRPPPLPCVRPPFPF